MNILMISAILAPSLPLVTGIARARRLSKGQWLLCALCAFYLLNQGIAAWTASYLQSNYPFFHLHIAVEMAALSWIYVLERGSIHGRKVQFMGMTLFLMGTIINAAWGEGLWNPPSLLLILESILLILLVIGFFWKTYAEMQVTRIEQHFLFWLSLGILIFFAGTILIDIFLKFVVEREEIFDAVFLIRDILILLTNSCYTIALLCKAHPQKS